jgi:4-diphosphocytidyl-2C-methyl-D-erythritol kinase
MDAGAGIGADVPFCIAAIAATNPQLGYSGDAEARSSALCEGIGDELSPANPERGWVVLIKPAVEVSTPVIYSDWDDLASDSSQARVPEGGAPAPGASQARGREGNDLAAAAMRRYPLIGEIMEEVRSVSCAGRIFMTGSGPTLVALHANETEASRDASVLYDKYKDRADVDAVLLSKLLS